MSDANSKPVAGASEPHELEERVAKVHHAAGCFAHEWDGCEMKDKFRATASAVLNLVRQEQEIETRRMVEDAITAVAETNIIGHDVQRIWRAMIRAWWLSHTAKETSNG